jgi:hypothetical protein
VPLAKQQISYVDIDDIEVQLSSPELPDSSVGELYRFGEIMLSDVRQTSSLLDTKLTSILGWSTATLAFLLLDSNSKAVNFAKPFLITAALIAMVSIGLSMLGLRSRLWPSPSEKDWFQDELLQEPSSLTRYHVVSLLASHQQHIKMNASKANFLRFAEITLMIAALLVAFTLFYVLFSR